MDFAPLKPISPLYTTVWETFPSLTSCTNSGEEPSFFNPGEYAFDDSHCANSELGAFWVFWAAGPDGDRNDMCFGGCKSKPYHPSNGLVSNGDIWKAYRLRDHPGRNLPDLVGIENSFF